VRVSEVAVQAPQTTHVSEIDLDRDRRRPLTASPRLEPVEMRKDLVRSDVIHADTWSV
jgi:hypothetical protein